MISPITKTTSKHYSRRESFTPSGPHNNPSTPQTNKQNIKKTDQIINDINLFT